MDHISANKSLPVTERENISGARVFDGEDQGAGNRYRMQQLQQKDWNEQQIEVKNQQKKLERETNALFDAQSLHVYDMLKETQSQHNKNRTANEQENDRINAIMAQEKRDRECDQHQEWARQEKHEVDFTLTHDFMTENQQTEVSMLATNGHRVKPYHFKGMTTEQTDQINLERQQQVKEASMMKQQEADENKLYAMQLEHQRRAQILNDRRMKRDLRGVQVEHKEFQETVQQPDHKAKWVDPYHERDIEHKHEGNKYVLGDTKWEERNTYSESIGHNNANQLHATTFTKYKYGRQQTGQHA